MVARGEEWRGLGQRVQSFSYIRQISSDNLMYSMITIVNNTVLCTGIG